MTTVARLRTWTSDNSLINDGRCASLARKVLRHGKAWSRLDGKTTKLHASPQVEFIRLRGVHVGWRARPRLPLAHGILDGLL